MELFAIEIRTSRLNEMILWYTNHLDLKVALRIKEDGYVLLAGPNLRVALLRRREQSLPQPGRISLAIETASLKSIRASVLEQAAPTQMVPDIKTNGEGFEELNLTDPDGNKVKFFRFVKRRD